MNNELFDVLENCLQALEAGETAESILARYPDLAKELRPLLAAAGAARGAGRPDTPREAQARGRARVLAVAARLRQEGKSHRRGRSWRVAFATLAVVAFLAISGNGLLAASAHALPGDTLYPFKRMVEGVQLQLAFDPSAKLELEDEFYQRRVDETESLIVAGRVESVDFDGHVEAQTPAGWIVEGIAVTVTPQTTVVGTVSVGAEVEVTGQTGPGGSVQARTIIVREDRDGSSGDDGGETEEPDRDSSHGNGEEETPEPIDTSESGVESTSEGTESGPDEDRSLPEPPTESTDDGSGDD